MFFFCWEKDVSKLLFIPSVSLTDPRAAAGTELLQALSQKKPLTN